MANRIANQTILPENYSSTSSKSDAYADGRHYTKLRFSHLEEHLELYEASSKPVVSLNLLKRIFRQIAVFVHNIQEFTLILKPSYDRATPMRAIMINTAKQRETSLYASRHFGFDEHFGRLSESDRIQLTDLLSLSSDHFHEVLRGANVKIQDNGYYHKKWIGLTGAYERPNSHSYMPGTSFGRRSLLFNEVLIWMGSDGNTHFQLEHTPMRHPTWTGTFINAFLHLLDFIAYKILKHQVGPFGLSPHTDRHSLVLDDAGHM